MPKGRPKIFGEDEGSIVNFRLPTGLREVFNTLCKQNKKDSSKVMRELIYQYIASYTKVEESAELKLALDSYLRQYFAVKSLRGKYEPVPKKKLVWRAEAPEEAESDAAW